MDDVYIAYALDDGDEVGPLGAMLRAAGYGVRFGALVEPGVNHRARAEQEIRSARAVLAIWSSHSVGSAFVRNDADYAANWGNLIAVRIDASAMPVSAAAIVDLSDGAPTSAGPGAEAILAAIAALSPPPSRPAVPAVIRGAGGREQHKGRDWRGIVGVSAVAILGLGGLGAAMLMSSMRERPEAARLAGVEAPVEDPDLLAGIASDPLSGAADEAGLSPEALALWAGLAKDDPLALRAFLGVQQRGSLAEEARRLLARLEGAAWSEALALSDAAGALQALEAYRAEYPDGRFLREAGDRERRERGRIAEVQDLLAKAGVSRLKADGILSPETLAGVKAFQASLSLPQTGLIDAPLLQALRAAGGREAGAPDSAESGSSGAGTAQAPAAAPAPAPVKATATAAAPSLGAPRGAVGPAFRDCYVCPEMIPLPPGSYVRGDATGAAPADERPAHSVSLSYGLAVGRFEVTFEEWDACLAESACRRRPEDGGRGRGNRPVVDVSPADIEDYLAWLTARTGKAYRLLSEAEWEYAARGGQAAAWHSGNDPANLCAFGNGADASSTYAWRNSACSDRYPDRAAPVGSFRPNGFGLHDMMGNVWEWTADCWHASYAGAPADGSAWVSGCTLPDRVLRGGAYSVDMDKLRSSYRYHFAPGRMPFFGFRVARQHD